MGRDYTLSHAACLCAQLPLESRVVQASMTGGQREAAMWTPPVRIAAMQLNELSCIRWLNSQDGYEGKNRPEPLLPPEMRDAEPEKPDAAAYKGALEALRKRIRDSIEGE